jgi:hypothetical protein
LRYWLRLTIIASNAPPAGAAQPRAATKWFRSGALGQTAKRLQNNRWLLTKH